MVVCAAIRIVRIPHRSCGAIVQRHTVEIVRARSGVRSRHGGIAESEAPLWGRGTTRQQPRVGLGKVRLGPFRRADLFLVVEARNEQSPELAARAAGGPAALGPAASLARLT